MSSITWGSGTARGLCALEVPIAQICPQRRLARRLGENPELAAATAIASSNSSIPERSNFKGWPGGTVKQGAPEPRGGLHSLGEKRPAPKKGEPAARAEGGGRGAGRGGVGADGAGVARRSGGRGGVGPRGRA